MTALPFPKPVRPEPALRAASRPARRSGLSAGAGSILLNHSHLRASRARIPFDLRLAWLDRLLCQQPEALFARQALKFVFHQPVFERVIAEDDPASSRIQSGGGP